MLLLEPQLRVMTADEAPAVVNLMQKIGWNHPVEQTKQYIIWGGEGSFCLSFDDDIVTTAIALKYSQRLAWVGLVVSNPDYQRRGFARRLMNHVMHYLSDVDSIMLDASTLGFPLYDSMGFQSLYKINIYTGAPQHFKPSPAIRPMIVTDVPIIIDMDSEVNGVPRPQVVNGLFESSKGFVATDVGTITGYTFVKTHLDTLRLAAWNAQDAATAESLLQLGSTLAAEGGYIYHINIPEPNNRANDMALRHNLTNERYVTRMVYGKAPPGHMSDQYGIISFMTG